MENQKLPIELLVVEDNPKHLADAREFFDEIEDGGFIRASYARDLKDVGQALDCQGGGYNGIMTDVFFPIVDGGPEEQNGVEVAKYCLEHKIPVVLITDTNHHGIKTEPIADWAGENNVPFFDRYPKDQYGELNLQGEAKSKNWKGAFLFLTYLIEGINSGELRFGDSGICRVDGGRIHGPDAFLCYQLENPEFKESMNYWLNNDELFKKVVKKFGQGLLGN